MSSLQTRTIEQHCATDHRCATVASFMELHMSQELDGFIETGARFDGVLTRDVKRILGVRRSLLPV